MFFTRHNSVSISNRNGAIFPPHLTRPHYVSAEHVEKLSDASRRHGVRDGHQAAAQGVPGHAAQARGEHPGGAAGEQHPGVALRDLRHAGLALRGRLLPRQAQVSARVPHEAAGRDDAHAQRPLQDQPAAMSQHVGLPPGDVEPHVVRQLHPHGTLLVHGGEKELETGINTTDAQKRKYAAASLEANCSNATFRKLFPDLVALQEEREKEKKLLQQLSSASDGAATASTGAKGSASENGAVIEDWSTTVYLIGSVLMLATFAAYWLS
ncbi:unnamed protein product [Phytophthora lilii]|uniref:Unnamed protein product n=1 Tax=Phytophthora lilii TaxID=2077276 RepID=A0A9W6TQZ8_9STRA|nr:unnamed protein product [Phytophthora lilii]